MEREYWLRAIFTMKKPEESFFINIENINGECSDFFASYFKETALFTVPSLHWIELLDKDSFEMLSDMLSKVVSGTSSTADSADLTILASLIYISDMYLKQEQEQTPDIDEIIRIKNFNVPVTNAMLSQVLINLNAYLTMISLIRKGTLRKISVSNGYALEDKTIFEEVKK